MNQEQESAPASKWPTWSKPLVFADPAETRTAALLYYLLLGFTLISGVGLIITLLFNPTGSMLIVAISGIVTLVWMIFFVIAQLGYVRLASLLVTGFFAVAVIVIMIADSEIRAPLAAASLIPIIVATLLLTQRAVISVTLFNLVALGGVYAADAAGWLPEFVTSDAPVQISLWATISFANVFAAMLLSLARRGIEGDFEAAQQQTVALRKSNGELQALRNNLETIVAERTQNAESAQQEAEATQIALGDQIWQVGGQAALADMMRGEQTMDMLARQVIQQVCEYVGALVGVIYLAENGRFHLMGSYAYTHRKKLSDQFGPGEGLVGQAALEKQPILLTDVPADYMLIQSGLGKTPPRNLLAVPFLYEDRVVGVLELGSVRPFSERSITFLKTAANSIAIAFNTAFARQRIDELLASTRQQTERLQAQEEELRASNEELASQTEALRQSESRLREQQRDLEMANAELEESSAALRNKQITLDLQNQELRTAQSELEKRAEELALASKYKSEFLANMSHELRTPLNSLLILARILANNEQGNLTPEQVESAAIIFSGGQDLLTLINEILDLSKIEAGRMDFNIAPMSIAGVIQSMELQFNHVAAEKEVEFVSKIVGDVPASIETDQQRIEQVIKNLLSNSFKFTEKGQVQLAVYRPTQLSDTALLDLSLADAVAIEVSDTGIGMTEAQQEIVFEGFRQADGSTSRKFGGTGLGLTISRQLVSNLGGHISVKSKLGEGSTFTVFLPWRAEITHTDVEEIDPPPQADMNPPIPRAIPAPVPVVATIADDRDRLNPSQKRLLIIEDDARFAKILYDYAHKRAFDCLVASSGERGLELVAQYQPDAIILDLNLPGMSGWDVLTSLKENPDMRHIPVHIISADDQDITAYKQGAIGFVSKPISQESLDTVFQKISHFIDKTIKTLLLVEDNAGLRHSVRHLLSGADVQVVEAGTGQKALAQLAARSFDCMILDLSLPDMTGFEIVERINTDETLHQCPIIVYTGRTLTEEENITLMQYADSVIVKGVRSPERLLDETALFLHRVVADMPAEKRQTINQLHNRETSLQEKRILAVDDDMRNAFALSRLLGERGLVVSLARSGQQALDMLDEKPTGYDLVLMDIMMPEMDGYETMQHIRSQSRFHDLPILALTAKAMKGDVEKCIAAGANDYLSKPVDAERLFSMLRVWLYQ